MVVPKEGEPEAIAAEIGIFKKGEDTTGRSFTGAPIRRRGHATLLHAACRFGRVACATTLLDRAPSVKLTTSPDAGMCGYPAAPLPGTFSRTSSTVGIAR